MKKTFALSLIGSGLFLAVAGTALAAQATLYNGGLGQAVTNPSQFGVAVCNRGAQVTTQSVPVDISVNGQKTEVSSAASIGVGKCAYSYVNYTALSLSPSTEYSVLVTVNNADQITYDMTVPANAPSGVSATANVDQQVGNVFTNFWKWLVGLFT